MTGSNTHNIKLYGAQADIWDAMINSRKNIIAVVPVGSGKTFLASLLLPIVATTPTLNMGRDVVYSAPTYPMIDRIMWNPLKKVCMEQYGLKDETHINNSKKIITFPDAGRIMCLSAETGLKGINAGLIVCDEAAEFSEESLQELTNRIRPAVGDPTSGGRMILISTPEGKNAFHKMYENALLHPDEWIVFHYTYEQMKSQSKAWVEKQRYLLSPLKFEKDLMCGWGAVEDQFYYSWKRSMAVLETKDRGKDLYTFHDFNKRVMCAIVAQVVGESHTAKGKIEILKSYAIKDCGTEQLAQTIRQDFPKRQINSIMDMSGAQVNRDTTSVFGVTDRTILEKYGFRIVNGRKSNPLISDTDNSANAFINQGRLAVPINEGQLLDAMETYHYVDATRKELVKYTEADLAHIDGLGDCVRYGIHHLFPMQHASDNLMPEYIDSDDRHFQEPGQQYIDQLDRDPVTGLPTAASIVREMMREVEGQEDEYWG
jgi:hypothetical protein